MPDAVLISGMVIANPLSWVCMASRGAPVRQHLGRCAHEQNPLIPSLQNGEPVGSPLTAVPCRGTNTPENLFRACGAPPGEPHPGLKPGSSN